MGVINMGDVLFQLCMLGFFVLIIVLTVRFFRSLSKRKVQLDDIERKIDAITEHIKRDKNQLFTLYLMTNHTIDEFTIWVGKGYNHFNILVFELKKGNGNNLLHFGQGMCISPESAVNACHINHQGNRLIKRYFLNELLDFTERSNPVLILRLISSR